MNARFRSVAVLAAMLLAASACSARNNTTSVGPGGPSAAPGSAGSSGTTLNASGSLFAYGFSYKTGDVVAKTRADFFTTKYPGVQIKYSESGFDPQQFLSALSGSNRPDVANIPRNVLGSYVARGVLEPLSNCIGRAGIDMSNFRDAAVKDVTVSGSVYALPEFFNTRLWLIDNTVFKAAGLDPATFDFSNWDQIAQANKKLAKVSGGKVIGIGIDPKIPEFLPLWAKANGADLLSPDGKTAKLNDPKVAEAVTFTTGLVKDQGGSKAFLDFRGTWDFFGKNNEFAKHQVAAFPMEQWYLNVLAQNSPNVDITYRPFLGRDGQPLTYEDGDGWAIVKGTKNMDAACAFISTMTSKDAWVAAAKARADKAKADGKPQTGIYTANKAADDVIFSQYVDLKSMPTFDKAVKAVLDTQDKAFGTTPSGAGQEFVTAWTDAVNRVLAGQQSATDSLNTAQQDAQAALDSAGG